MGILSRISKILEANINNLLDKAEDPAKMLEQAIDDMRKGRDEARKAIIDAKTEMRLLEKRREKSLVEAVDLEKKAVQSLKAGDEGAARRFIELKIAAEGRAEAEGSASQEHKAQISQLEVAERELDRRLGEMPAKRAALLARHAAAEAKGARVGATSKAQSSVASALQAFDRMEEKVIRAEVEAEVVTESHPHLLIAPSLEAMRADEELQALKDRLARQLSAGASQPSAADGPADRPNGAANGKVDDDLASLKAKLREGSA